MKITKRDMLLLFLIAAVMIFWTGYTMGYDAAGIEFMEKAQQICK